METRRYTIPNKRQPSPARFFPIETTRRQIAQRMSQSVQRRGTCVYVLRDFIVNSERSLQTAFGGQSGTTQGSMTTQMLPSRGSHSAARPAANNDYITPLSQLTKFTARWTILARCTCKRTMTSSPDCWTPSDRMNKTKIHSEKTSTGLEWLKIIEIYCILLCSYGWISSFDDSSTICHSCVSC